MSAHVTQPIAEGPRMHTHLAALLRDNLALNAEGDDEAHLRCTCDDCIAEVAKELPCCEWHPVNTRNLSACAHNLVVNLEAALNGGGDWQRVRRKMETLRRALESVRPSIDEHFATHLRATPSGEVPSSVTSKNHSND